MRCPARPHPRAGTRAPSRKSILPGSIKITDIGRCSPTLYHAVHQPAAPMIQRRSLIGVTQVKSTNTETSGIAEVIVASPIGSDGERHRAECVQPEGVSVAELVRAFAEELALGEGVSVRRLLKDALKIEAKIEHGPRERSRPGLKPRDWQPGLGMPLERFGLRVAIREALGGGHREAIKICLQRARQEMKPRPRALTNEGLKKMIDQLREALRHQAKKAPDHSVWRRNPGADRMFAEAGASWPSAK